MKEPDVRERLRELLVQVFHVSPQSVDDAATLEELGLDSLTQVELFDRLREDFAVDIPDDETVAATTVGDVVALVTEKTASMP
ncbi:acyl carrier protein [Streptomyces sp. NPDC127068]|uniref:acyl carrier protein n=1 Tax=Streptomyces sp. NPDC127068 TaxID=3347127 RepID=UPI0036629931